MQYLSIDPTPSIATVMSPDLHLLVRLIAYYGKQPTAASIFLASFIPNQRSIPDVH